MSLLRIQRLLLWCLLCLNWVSCLRRGCSKADLRAVALEAVSSLLPCLPAGEQHRFVLFLARLSRTQAINHRLVAVEISSELILNFEGALKPQEAAAAADAAAALGAQAPTPGKGEWGQRTRRSRPPLPQ